MSKIEFKNSWRFEAEITTKTPLHIGSGGTAKKARPVKGKEPVEFEANAVITDYQGRAYLPGKAIKGAMRSWLSHVQGLPHELIEEVFGSEDTKKKDSVGGKAEFHDAFFVHHDRSAAKAPYWNGQRLTGVMAHTAIVRTSKTVRDEKLFHEEFVPPGVTFKVVLTGQNLSYAEEAGLLLFALKGFGRDDLPIRLGAGEQNLRGEFTLDPKTIHIRCLEAGGVAKWLRDRNLPSGLVGWKVVGGGYNDLPDAESQRKVLEKAAKNWHITPPALLKLKLRIAFDPAFMVHDPTRGQSFTGDDTLSDHRALLDTQGDLLLPADSFRGAFRSQAERILRTMGVQACDPQGPDACKAIHAEGEERTKLCPACRIFGAGGWASALQVSDFTAVPDKKGSENRQDFVAIDRFTGGASAGKKFDAEPYWNPVLEGTIALELDRTDPWALGLIALTLRDLIEGDITFGFGVAKGYGACTAEVVNATNPAEPQPLKGWKELRDRIQPLVEQFRQDVTNFKKGEPLPPLSLSPTAIATSSSVSVPPQATPTAAAGTPFYNPYHFVPVKGTEGRPGDINAKTFFEEGKIGHITHDRYVDGSFSGRVLCSLTAEDPFVVGARQDDARSDHSHEVEPFTVDQRPAIPASSLRGLISSIAEAASNSALRVLNDKALSVRMTMDEALPAIGMVREETVNGKTIRVLQPLTFPMNLPWDSTGRNARLPNDCLGIYEKCSPPAYVEGYRKIPNPDPHEHRPLPGVEPAPGTFLEMQRPLSFSSYNKREFWWAKLPSFSFTRGTVSFPTGGQRLNSFNNSRLVGSQIDDLLSDEEYVRKGRPDGYTRGIVRVLGFEGHEKEIPHGKKHEIFIPFSSEQEDINRAKTFEMNMALSAFERLAAERRSEQREDEAYLPFDLKRPAPATKKEIRLRDGDLVFFKASGGRTTEIALSSIWRKGKESVHAYFASVSPELLPMNSNRGTISLAEQLFGFVEEMKKGKAEERTAQSARALAGRVRFSFGLLDPAVQEGDFWEYDEPKPLKLLSSPKPPCPALYFYQQGGAYIMKRQLTVGRHFPQGRKFYLHRNPSEQEPWLAQINGEDKHTKQRLYARPVKKDSIFYFHVEFHNLSKDELGLLCYALQPSGEFRHKLGLGKPVGLGKVAIKPLGIFHIPRNNRYNKDPLKEPRFLAVSNAQGDGTARLPWSECGERFFYEASALMHSSKDVAKWPTFETLRKKWRDAMDERIRWAIELIGDPGSIERKIPVHYPRLAGQGEEELYKWFMEDENKDRTDRFPLPPVEVNNPLPTLPHLTPTPRPARPGGGGGRGQSRGGGQRDHGRTRRP